jgi:hypothetical protein
VVEDRDPEHDIDRVVRHRQIVRGSDDELRPARASVDGEAAAREPDEVLGHVDAADVRAASAEHQRVRARSAPDVENAETADRTEQVIAVLEGEGGVPRRCSVAGELHCVEPQRCVTGEGGFDGAAPDLGALPRLE